MHMCADAVVRKLSKLVHAYRNYTACQSWRIFETQCSSTDNCIARSTAECHYCTVARRGNLLHVLHFSIAKFEHPISIRFGDNTGFQKWGHAHVYTLGGSCYSETNRGRRPRSQIRSHARWLKKVPLNLSRRASY